MNLITLKFICENKIQKNKDGSTEEEIGDVALIIGLERSSGSDDPSCWERWPKPHRFWTFRIMVFPVIFGVYGGTRRLLRVLKLSNMIKLKNVPQLQDYERSPVFQRGMVCKVGEPLDSQGGRKCVVKWEVWFTSAAGWFWDIRKVA